MPLRLVVAALAAVVVAVSLGAGGTLARWYETEPLAGSELASGRIELTAAGVADLTVPVMIESKFAEPTTVELEIVVSNQGNVPLEFLLDDTVVESDTDDVVGSLDVGFHSGSCPSSGDPIPLSTGVSLPGASFVDFYPAPIAAHGDVRLCLALTAPAGYTTGFRSGTGAVTLRFFARSTIAGAP